MDLTEIYGLPAHLIRRSQQIAVSLFFEECRDFGITSIQFGTLCVICERRELEQYALANMLALDRSNVGDVVARLEDRGLIGRRRGTVDRRTKLLFPTPAGEALVKEMEAAVLRANARVLAPLDQDERAAFMSMLAKLVDINNDHSRAPLRPTRAG
jgi:DNA-binding MarR family transcriptional regulator